MNKIHLSKWRLPPMHALLALDAFARSGTVEKAARALGVTRSAISHRLSLLEELVGFEVLWRSGKGVVLTQRGKRYALEIHKSLTVLSDAQTEACDSAIEGVLRVSSTPGFASMWLCSHIASFHAAYTNLQLQIVVSRQVDDVSASDVDVFIAFGDGNWPNHARKLLYNVEFLPVCSPALLNLKGGLSEPGDVLHFPLLQIEGRDDWKRWFEHNGITFPDRINGITFADMMLVQASAFAGQGVMIGDNVTCAVPLASGQLIAPFPNTMHPFGAYYLVSEHRNQTNPAVIAFTSWLEALIGKVGIVERRRHSA